MVQPNSEVGSVPTEPEGRTTERALSLPQSTALIMGSIIGVGIFSLPYALASYGPISLVAMGLATVGAVALALMFAVMSRRLPAAGGPYASKVYPVATSLNDSRSDIRLAIIAYMEKLKM